MGLLCGGLVSIDATRNLPQCLVSGRTLPIPFLVLIARTNTATLQEDPELKPLFEEIKKEGMSGLMKCAARGEGGGEDVGSVLLV